MQFPPPLKVAPPSLRDYCFIDRGIVVRSEKNVYVSSEGACDDASAGGDSRVDEYETSL